MSQPAPHLQLVHPIDCDCPLCEAQDAPADRDRLRLTPICLLCLAGIGLGQAIGWALDHAGAAAPLIGWLRL